MCPSQSDPESGTGPGKRIGEVAALTGVTTRTLRYYEELGLIAPDSRQNPTHGRRYSSEEIERVRRIKEMQEFLGAGLIEIRDALQAEDKLAGLRLAYRKTTSKAAQAAVLREAVALADRQLLQVGERIDRLQQLQAELRERRQRHLQRLEELSAEQRRLAVPKGDAD
ncbi:MAG: MerR family transcriptional regulator [Candidatus Dormibacteraeota bacterium]|jgi:DNA-binding transcriptional MerR regulator|nr:MerR family transcriptional regulator [Candidatus Dormibacteraeota bacterium]